MSPTLALFIWLILLLFLFVFDPARDPKTSVALWVPLAWLCIVASRLPSQWLGVQVGMGGLAHAFEEGNSIDSTVYSVLILLAIAILIWRSFRWGKFFARNFALTALLSYALLSVLWSDFPFITFKHWFRDLGNYLAILVVLSDPRPLEAVRTLLRRLAYLLIPLSILLVKYFPAIGRQYGITGEGPYYSGATTSKNMLGVLCLVSALFFFWDTVTRWPDRKERQTRRIVLINVALMGMTLWLLVGSQSATSKLCLALGFLVIAAAQTKTVKRHPGLLTVSVPIGICLYLVLAFGFGININTEIARAVGRDATLTGRTVIWDAVLSTHTNPLVGSGYETFWLGPRLEKIWGMGVLVNEAHDGYLEVYLNLGIIGLFLLTAFLISSYRTARAQLKAFPILGSFTFALWSILPLYNITESAFRGQLMWVIFLLGAMVVPTASPAGALAPAELPVTDESIANVQDTVTI